MPYTTNYPYATTAQQYGVGSHYREEQRRRQQDYSEALAQQVAEREEQKRQERERNRFPSQIADRYQNPHKPRNLQDPFAAAERGFFDGLGHNNPQNSRTNFARGHQKLAPNGQESVHYFQNSTFPQRQWSNSVLPQPTFIPTHHQSTPNFHNFQNAVAFPNNIDFAPNQQDHVRDTNAPYIVLESSELKMQNNYRKAPISPQNQPSQDVNGPFKPLPGAFHESPILQQAPSGLLPNGRRQRTDIHDTCQSISEETKRFRVKQQQELQRALEQQIEEKRQQKLEAKRRQDEEDRREMRRFEDDQRRQRAEQERMLEEKRRKAQLQEQKANQLAAAVTMAHQEAQAQPQQHRDVPFEVPPQPQKQLSSPSLQSSLKDPFTNSRAHLFKDPSPRQLVPQTDSMHSNNQTEHLTQNARTREDPPESSQSFQHRLNAGNGSLTSLELRQQYDDLREELRRQKQLVDQLRHTQAQMQQCQPSPKRAESGNAPTLLDLEQLRNELHQELAHREQIHQQELVALKQDQCQQQAPQRVSPCYSRTKSSVKSPTLRQKQQNIEPVTHTDEIPMNECLKSLQGESRLVFYDEKRQITTNSFIQDVPKTGEEQLEDALDEQSEYIHVDDVQARPSTQLRVSIEPQSSEESALLCESKWYSRNDVSDDEEHGFVVLDMPPYNQKDESSPFQKQNLAASSHRYAKLAPAMLLSSSSPFKQATRLHVRSKSIKRLSDSDDELDASLDGEQLERLFQRNVRRHEILLGFQKKSQEHMQYNSNQRESTIPSTTRGAEVQKHAKSTIRDTFQRHSNMKSCASNDSNLMEADDRDTALTSSSQWI